MSRMANGTLYIVATPIGNLEDVTLRALRVLKEVDVVLAEDTRVTKKLLARYGIETKLMRYDEHVAERMHGVIAKLLNDSKHIALVSDAGTPGISDPGSRLVTFVREHSSAACIVPIPGPSALMTALSVSGLPISQFTFLGYPPHKKGRKTFFELARSISMRPVALYESPHRLSRTFADMRSIFGAEHQLFVAKELTKIYEEIWHGAVSEAETYFSDKKGKGEFVIIIK